MNDIRQTTNKYYMWIDAMKGIAILMVVMIHSGAGTLSGFIGKLGDIGKFGATLFLLISAFLSYASYEKFSLKSKINPIIWIIKKVFRLIPLSYIAYIIYTIHGGSVYWLGSEGHVTFLNFIFHIFMLHGLVPHYANSIVGVEWYIGILVIFYMILPILFKYIRTLERSILFLIISIFSCYIITSSLNKFISTFVDYDIYSAYINVFSIFAQLPVISLGIVLYYLFKKLSNIKIKESAVLSYSLLVFGIIMIFGEIKQANQLYHISIYVRFAIWFALICLSQNIKNSKIIVNKFLALIGKYSYGIYLFHYIVLRYINFEVGSTMLNWLIKYIICILISFALSFVLTKYYEKPIIKVLDDKLTMINKTLSNSE